jgi:Uncharacterised nucleotidyltransferase
VPGSFTEISSAEAVTPPGDAAGLWESVEKLLRSGSVEGLLAHGLGPLAAQDLRRRGLHVPSALRAEEYQALLRMLAVEPLLNLVRASCDGPLVLMKGPEIAFRYPGSARAFVDLDLLVPDARTAHAQLRDCGFLEFGDPELYYRLHHRRPLSWPDLPLLVEIHSAPKWPDRLAAPDTREVIDNAIPSAVGVEGVLAPDPARHAVLIAAHAWAHQPLRRLRDLVDIRAIALEADAAEMDRLARSWQLARAWRTTAAVADALFDEGRRPLALRLWARHLSAVRERTVLETHLQDAIAGFWGLSLGAAAAAAGVALASDLRRAPEETWSDKLVRAVQALRDAFAPLSHHDALLGVGDAASRGRGRNLQERSSSDLDEAVERHIGREQGNAVPLHPRMRGELGLHADPQDERALDPTA